MNSNIAGLKIKFIPVMKDFHKDNSKCCLEIVPEISGVQNFDKIKWKGEDNSTEYIIPMTYKIILKKLPREMTKVINDNFNKVYYSCVDLLPPSSITKLNMASGDVKRIISDTYVVTKVTTNVDEGDDMQMLLNHNEEDIKQEPADNQITNNHKPVITEMNDFSINTDQKRDDSKMNNHNDKVCEDTLSLNTLATINVNRQSIDKITNTESDFALYTDAYTQSGETITCVSTIMNSSKAYCSRKLSQTPVCSVDTKVIKENMSANSVIYYINEINKEATCIANICTINNIYRENYLKNKVVEQIKAKGNCKNVQKHFTRRKRILPEIRVAELVQVMEKEIMPLKIMLNEILNKCATLGLTWTKRSQISLMYKSIDPKCNDQTDHCKKVQSSKPLKSNRVVYSIVFEG